MNKYFKWFGLPGSLVLTLLISLFAIVLAVINPSLPRCIVAVAMMISSLGDIILMDYKPVTDKLPFRGFVSGAIVFAVSHLVYICAFGYKIYDSGYPYLNYGVLIAIFLFITAALATTVFTIGRREGNKKLLIPCLIYLFVILANCATVFSCAFSEGGTVILSALGIFSFFVSDCFIVAEDVCGYRSKTLKSLIWWFYPIGQILLIAGI